MTEHNNEQPTPDNNDHEDGKLAAEAARRRVQAREANERADAAEAEAESLRQQIAELRLSQARQAVTAKHPELTAELIDQFAPDNIDADGLAAWADKALGLVVALRGEAPVDADAMSDTEKELAAAQMELARSQAVAMNPHVTGEVLETLCAETTPEGVGAWAAAFERIVTTLANKSAEPTQLQLIMQGVRANKVGGGKMKDTSTGLKHVAQKLTNR